MTVDLDKFVDQFVLARSSAAIPPAWRSRSIGPWHLGHHEHLPVAEIRAADGAAIGWLLGWVVGDDARFVRDAITLDTAVDAADAPARFEETLYGLGGRFAAVSLLPAAPRLYLDVLGSLSAVFDASRQVAASTPLVIPDVRPHGSRAALDEAVGAPTTEGFYPFGLTPWADVERLLPNHYLDLADWRAVRHWPTGDLAEDDDVDGALGTIINTLRGNLDAVFADYPVCASITAGRDTRMMLSCLRDRLQSVRFFTLRVQNSLGRIDVATAGHLARRFRLDHRFLATETPTPEDLALWRQRTGECHLCHHPSIVAAYRSLGADRAVIMGSGGELGRGSHWRRGDTPESCITAEDLVARLGFPPCDVLDGPARRWLNGLPVGSAITTWALLHNEHLNGCSSGPLLYGLVDNAMQMLPFSCRRIIDTMMRLPVEYRRSGRMVEDMIARGWSELLRVPMNWPIGMDRVRHFVGRRLQAVGRAVRDLAGGGRGTR